MKPTEHDLLEPDTFDVLSATWVCACNDENSIITFEGIRHRLNLGPSFDIKGLIQSRGDLFRRTVPSRRLEAWKHGSTICGQASDFRVGYARSAKTLSGAK